MRGIMDGWHAPAVEEAVNSFYGDGSSMLTLDLSDLKFAGMEGAASMIRMLRTLRPELRIYTVAQGHLSSLLHRADLGSFVRICGSIDEAAEAARPEPEYTTSRWMAYTDDIELPLAA